MSSAAAFRWACGTGPRHRAVDGDDTPTQPIVRDAATEAARIAAALDAHPGGAVSLAIPPATDRDDVLAYLHACLDIAVIALEQARRAARRAQLGTIIDRLDHVHADVDVLSEITELPGA